MRDDGKCGRRTSPTTKNRNRQKSGSQQLIFHTFSCNSCSCAFSPHTLMPWYAWRRHKYIFTERRPTMIEEIWHVAHQTIYAFAFFANFVSPNERQRYSTLATIVEFLSILFYSIFMRVSYIASTGAIAGAFHWHERRRRFSTRFHQRTHCIPSKRTWTHSRTYTRPRERASVADDKTSVSNFIANIHLAFDIARGIGAALFRSFMHNSIFYHRRTRV